MLALGCSSGEPESKAPKSSPKPVSPSPVPRKPGPDKTGSIPSSGGGVTGGSVGGRPAALEVAKGIDSSLAEFPGYHESRKRYKTIGYSSSSALRGQSLYKKHCAMCHGANGSGPPRKNYNRTRTLRDLREPYNYRYGGSDQAIYRSIMYGIPRSPMGNNQKVFKEKQVWDLVNFLQSISK